MKHTKGEWVLKEQGDANEYCIVTPEHKWVVAFRLNGERDKEGVLEEKANAELIAAAPELLEACVAALSFVCVEEPAFDIITDTIKKATE